MTRIALLQMNAVIDPARNAETLAASIERAGQEGAAMMFAPELAGMVDQDMPRALTKVTEEHDDSVLTRVCEAARAAGIWVHLGSLTLKGRDGRLVNRGLVIDREGAVRARYDKLHLFDVDLPTGESWRESDSYTSGETATVVDTPVGPVGLAICYDLRFPDLFRALSDAGAEVLSIPAAFTRPTGAAHWQVMLRARAIEAGAWVVAAAQVGRHEDGRETWGHSMVVDPWGEVILDMEEAEGLGFAEIDPARTVDVRLRVPALRHRRAIPAVTRG